MLLLGGCANHTDAATAATALQESRSAIIQSLKAVAADLSRAGGPAYGAVGVYLVCGSSPTDAIEYRAGAKLRDDGSPLADRMRSAVKALESAGWKVTAATYTDDPYPNARLDKDGLKLSLDPDALRGSNALSFGTAGECIRVARHQVADFSREDIDLEQ